jgi:hypothetical protein
MCCSKTREGASHPDCKPGPALPPQPSWRIRAMMLRKLRSRHRACASLTICTLPHRSHSILGEGLGNGAVP